MLQDIRDNSQGVIAKVIIGLIVAVFALFGVESIIGGFITSPPVAEVNGEEITEAQLQFSTQNLLASLGGADVDQSLLEQVALNQLIEETILQQSADRANMVISSDRLDRSILQNPNFQINGVFDPDLAIRTMASQGYNVPLYRESLAQSMLLGQIVNAYSSSNFITESELETIAELGEQTRDFRYVSVTMGTRTLGTPISDEEIREYYEANQDEFIEPESVVLRYVSLNKADIADEITVDEAELRAQYEAERSEFEGGSEKRASHILWEVGSGQTEDEVIAEAAAVKQRILDGEDFGELALEYSIDIISAEEGGDIGYTDGTAFPEAVEAALESLSLNEISDPVVSEFGVHLVKLTEDAERVFESFEEVSDRIERELKSAEVDLIYNERLEDLSNLAFESADLLALSEQLGLEIQQSEAIGRQGGPGILGNPSVVSAAFSDEVLLEGNNSDAVEVTDSQAIVLRVEQFNESSVLPLEEVEAEIAVLLRTEMERQAVQELGERLAIAAEEGGDLEALLAENDLEWVEATETKRDAFNVNREIVTHIFGMPAPEGSPVYSSVTLANDTFVLVELNAVNPGSLDSLPEAERDQIRNSIRTDLGSSDFGSFLVNLRDTADINAPALEADAF
jgi:peptidyl-prolyl cis-trans isomerase D